MLITCFIGQLFNWPVDKEYLSEGSLYKKTRYYEILGSLIEKGLLKLVGDDVVITEEGVRRVRSILIGDSTKELTWENIRAVMEKYIPESWKGLIRKEKEGDHFLKILLLAYSDSLGDSPQTFYPDLINRFTKDFLLEKVLGEQDNFSKKLRQATTYLVEVLLKKMWKDKNQEMPEPAKKHLDKLMELGAIINELVPAVAASYVYGFDKWSKILTNLMMSGKIPKSNKLYIFFYTAYWIALGGIVASTLLLLLGHGIYLTLLKGFTCIAFFMVFLPVISATSTILTSFLVKKKLGIRKTSK